MIIYSLGDLSALLIAYPLSITHWRVKMINPPHPAAMNKIGILATGNELMEGELINSNAQQAAQLLSACGLVVGTHLVAGDELEDLTRSLHFLLEHHAVVLTIGGLGPTSDDQTRHGVAAVCQKSLIASEAHWLNLVQRYETRLKRPCPTANRQQIYFPERAEIIDNIQGSAPAFSVTTAEGRQIISLPGPPRECLPLVESWVIPHLVQKGYAQAPKRYIWQLLGMPESDAAENLNALNIDSKNAVIRYRASTPYLTIKLDVLQVEQTAPLCRQIEALFQRHLVARKQVKASQMLATLLETPLAQPIVVIDSASGGRIRAALLNQRTQANLCFDASLVSTSEPSLIMKVSGLEHYWQQPLTKHPESDRLTLTITQNNVSETATTQVYSLKDHALNFTVEYACWKLLQFLNPGSL